MIPARPNHVEIDPAAFARNLALLQNLLPQGTAIWQVCKGDGYGLGALAAARLGDQAGLTRFCAGTPAEALELKAAFPQAEVLLFPSALAGDLPFLARAGILPTVHNLESLCALQDGAPEARYFIKVNTGLNRYGFDEKDLLAVLTRVARTDRGQLLGLYTHFSQATDQEAFERGRAIYDRLCKQAEAILGRKLTTLAAASPVALVRPDLPYDAVDVGRALYGMLRPEEAGGQVLSPVVREIRSTLLEIRSGSDLGATGYGSRDGTQPTRIGTFPLGHFDGLAGLDLGTVLVRGQKVRVLSRTLLAAMVDLSTIDDAAIGDAVILAGKDGALSRDIFGLADDLGTSATMLHFGLVRAIRSSAPAQ